MREGRSASAELSMLAVLHAAVLFLFLSWRYGGMEPGARFLAGWLVLPAPVITACALWRMPPDLRRRALWIIVPLALFALQIGIGALNPCRKEYLYWDTPVLRAVDFVRWLPTSALPGATIGDFGLNAGLALCGLNLMLTRPARPLLRGVLWLVAINGLVLAGVGTVFHLRDATAILGKVPSPNPNFFSTFVYHNHWGAFALLCAGSVWSLALYIERRTAPTPLTQTPAPFLGLIGLVIITAIPLSSARAATVAAGLLMLGTGALLAIRLTRRMRDRSSDAPRRIGMIITAMCVAAFGLMLTRETWRKELAQSREQIADFRGGGIGDARFTIYGDTLRLIAERPVFGWGWQSFQYVYPEVQSEIPRMQSRISRYAVLDAHNDWLQLLAETGVGGLLLLTGVFVGILRWPGGRRPWVRAPQSNLAITLAALGALALVDFPMACPAVVLTAAILLGVAGEMARGSAQDGLRTNRSGHNTG